MGRGSGGHSPPDAEKTFKIEHVRSLEILAILQTHSLIMHVYGCRKDGTVIMYYRTHY